MWTTSEIKHAQHHSFFQLSFPLIKSVGRRSHAIGFEHHEDRKNGCGAVKTHTNAILANKYSYVTFDMDGS